MGRTTNKGKELILEDEKVEGTTSPPKKKLSIERQKDLSEKAAAKKLKAMMPIDISDTKKRRVRREQSRLRAGASSKPSDLAPLYPTLSKTPRRKLRTVRKLALEKGLPFNEEAFVKQQEIQALQTAQQELERKEMHEKCVKSAWSVKNGLKSLKRTKAEVSAVNGRNVAKRTVFVDEDSENQSPKEGKRVMKNNIQKNEKKSATKRVYEHGDYPKDSPKRAKRAKKSKSESMSLTDNEGVSKAQKKRVAKESKSGSTSLREKEGSANALSKVEKKKILRKRAAKKKKWELKQKILLGGESKDARLVERKQRFVLFAGNLPYSSTEDKLMVHFSSQEHQPINIRIQKEKITEMPRGFAYVEYSDVAGYQFGFTKHHSTLEGRMINVMLSESGKANTKKKPKSRKPQGLPILV